MRGFVAAIVLALLIVGRLRADTASSQVSMLTKIFLPPTGLPSRIMPIRKEQLHDVHRIRFFLPSLPSPTQLRMLRASYEPSPAPEPSLTSPAAAAAPFRKLLPSHHHHRHHHHRPRSPHGALSPGPAMAPGCGLTCLDPFTSKPIGSPCGCVIPLKVKLLLHIVPYDVFTEINELAIELAEGTYIKRSQVQIVGAVSDPLYTGQALVDINLVPLGNKFDVTTATLISESFWKKDVKLNKTLFGSYEVISITYPGIPLRPPGPSRNDPIPVPVPRTSYKMSIRTVLLIVFSATVVCLAFCAALYIIINCKKIGRPSNAVGPLSGTSINTRNGIRHTLSNSGAGSRSMSLFSSIQSALSLKTFSLEEIVNATENFSPSRVLGEGGFGRVYHGILEDGTEAAVKLLTRDDQNGDHDFIAEVEILSRLHHRNLVKLIGICIEGQKRCLLYQLVPNGSVDSHLHGADKEKGDLDWDARMKIAIGAARGLAYLHEDSNPRVIHRDFKSSNILLEDDFTPKVSDFGLAREATEGSHHVSTRVMGTFGYVAPEYAMTGHLLVKSDVYSYGVVLLELLTGRKPVVMSEPRGQENLVTWARPHLSTREGLQKVIDPFLLSKTSNFDNIAKVASIASMCVHPEVAHRPFMGEVVQALKLIHNDVDEAGGDCGSQPGSSVPDQDSFGPSDSSWWNAGGLSPAFITMDYSSGRLEEHRNWQFSASSLGDNRIALPVEHGNLSGPLRTAKNRLFFSKLRGSMSEHGGLLRYNKG